MAGIASVLKFVFVYLLPFYLIQLYLKHAYGVGAGTIIHWWAKNWGGLEHPVLVILFTFLGVLFSTSTTSGVLDKVYLSVFGENHHLVYLGNNKQSMGRYIPAKEFGAAPMKSSTGQYYNYSFKPIYRIAEFRKDPLGNSAGTRVTEFGVGRSISHFLALTFIYVFLICMLHIFAHPVSAAASGGAEVELASMDNLKTFLKQWNLTVGKLSLVFFGALVLAVPVVYLFHYTDRGERVYPLPDFVVPGSTIQAKPIAVDIESGQVWDSQRDRYESIRDTGYRNVIYEFAERFPKPVYVTARFYKYDYPELESRIERHIEEGRPMEVEIQEGLRIFPKL